MGGATEDQTGGGEYVEGLSRLGGATNQPFVWLRYGGLWSDAEIIIYYYRAKAFPSELEIGKLPTNCQGSSDTNCQLK